ncbi:MAG: hypothetical protein JWR88_443, partial [Pseudonocardia sp.]|nr:hypothetical protein [Pseudonocardia sp.]
GPVKGFDRYDQIDPAPSVHLAILTPNPAWGRVDL